MQVTEVRVKIVEDRSDKLQAFCSITIDNGFVIRDLKVIEGTKGAFVAMPSRKLTDRCPKCSGKNHLRAGYCNDCGARLPVDRADRDPRGRAKLHADIAHPINSATRDGLQKLILDAYRAEVERSKMPGYVPPKMFDDEDFADDYEHFANESAPREQRPAPESRPMADRGAGRAEDDFSSGIV
jgi:stage V sporulation protein G